jgi:hypothetical protein
VYPVGYELDFYILEDGILLSDRRENLRLTYSQIPPYLKAVSSCHNPRTSYALVNRGPFHMFCGVWK